MLNALRPEEKLLAARCHITVESVTRRSERLYDVEVDGTTPHPKGEKPYKISAWLPLVGIRETIAWTNPHVARMSDHESMVREGDWSGIRDSSTEKIWAIFDRFVIPVLLPCGNTLTKKGAAPKEAPKANNWKLAKAAPELLDLLKQTTEDLASMIEGEHDDPSVGITGYNSMHQLVKDAREKIAEFS